VPELCQVIGRSESCRTGTYNSYLFIGWRGNLDFPVSVVLGCKTFKVAYSYRFIYLATSAFILTGMGTNITEDCRERYLLSYHRQCIGEFLFINKANIAWNINTRRADLSTADKVFTRPLCLEVSQGTGRANFNTGATKMTCRILSGRSYSAYDSFAILPDKTKSTYTTHILAYPYTTGAANAQVIIPFEKRLVFDNR